MSRYDTDPPEDLRARYRRALEEAVDGAADALDGAGKRNGFRMHYTLREIEQALDAVDYTTDRRSARALGKIRARIEAYRDQIEGGHR